MAFGTLFYAGAAIFQVSIMKQSLHDVSLQTDKLINAAQAEASAARKNADAAASFSTSADKIREETSHAVDQLRRAAKDSETAMRESSRNAQNALNASIEASKLDKRAWFGISETEVLQYDPSDPAKPFRFQILFQNTGKTPARQVHIAGVFQVYDSIVEGPTDSDWKPLLEYFDKVQERYVVGPNATRRFMVPGPDFDITAAQQNSPYGPSRDLITRNYLLFKERTKYLSFFGQATYLDIDNRQHTTTFCLWFFPEMKRLANCGKGNDMKDRKSTRLNS